MAGEGRRRGEDEKILTPPALVFIPFLSLREEYCKILLSFLLKAANHKFLVVTQCFVGCELITK